MNHSDLAVDAFLLLRDSFFDAEMRPVPFDLRPKRNTQDDPLDEHVASLLEHGLPDAICHKAPGPLINPDLVLYRPELCDRQTREKLSDDRTRIVAVEVKKLQRTKSGRISRHSGLDYNTTPPCGTVRVYATDDSPLDIKGFYLFVAQEPTPQEQYLITALALCDGDLLNEDFDLYLASVGERAKKIGLGTYGDGMDRQRPMFVFANPLGASQLDHQATLVTGEPTNRCVQLVYQLVRTSTARRERQFFAYRRASDVPHGWEVETLKDPFPQPNTRVEQTQPRGKFRLPIEII
jgi:hypothetical protein